MLNVAVPFQLHLCNYGAVSVGLKLNLKDVFYGKINKDYHGRMKAVKEYQTPRLRHVA